MMKIACIGSNLESEACLKLFYEKGFSVDLLITRPENNAGSVSDYVNLHDFARGKGIKCLSTINVNSAQTIEELKNYKIDVLLTLGWSQIFRSEFLSSFGLVIGSHPTLLPVGRGRAPVPWTILNGVKNSAVSFFKMDKGVDTGDVILQKKFEVPERPYAAEVYSLVADALSNGFVDILLKLERGEELTRIDLNEDLASHTAKRTRLDGRLDFSKKAESIDLLVRAVSHPYPGAYSYYKDQRVYFFSSELEESDNYSGVVGQILERTDSSIRVKCSHKSVWLSDFRLDNGDLVDSTFFRVHDMLGIRVEDELFELKRLLRDKGIID